MRGIIVLDDDHALVAHYTTSTNNKGKRYLHIDMPATTLMQDYVDTIIKNIDAHKNVYYFIKYRPYGLVKRFVFKLNPELATLKLRRKYTVSEFNELFNSYFLKLIKA